MARCGTGKQVQEALLAGDGAESPRSHWVVTFIDLLNGPFPCQFLGFGRHWQVVIVLDGLLEQAIERRFVKFDTHRGHLIHHP
jgi:hypothetical protein